MVFFQFFLKVLFVIHGIGAASGLVVDQNYIYAVSDDNASLFIYNTKKHKVETVDLNPEVKQQKGNKKDKPDFETITRYKNQLFIAGSGSKENRFDLISYDLKTKQVHHSNYNDLFDDFLKISKLSQHDFNIEGMIATDHATYFFNRGNGPAKMNGIFKVNGAINDLKNQAISFHPIQLPELNGELTTFSDAILVNDKVLFTATVESKSSTQYNGEVKGSIIGELDLQSNQVVKWKKISDHQKIEGLALLKETRKHYSLYLCEDNDDDSKQASIYQFKLAKTFE